MNTATDIFILSQRYPGNLTPDRWHPVGEPWYPTLPAAIYAADGIEIRTGHRVAIDRVCPDGTSRRVRDPEQVYT